MTAKKRPFYLQLIHGSESLHATVLSKFVSLVSRAGSDVCVMPWAVRGYCFTLLK